ncbi:hypothetical protein AGMMS50256_27030 [Betaproteobacteria bacterium]|nr:hypothetical protein AGMMS50256_27030 [Betaproteobacteria bacterium]
MQRFFVLCAIFLTVMLSMPDAHAEADDNLTENTGRNAALLPFNDVVIVAADSLDAAQKTHDAIVKGAQARKWQVTQNTPAAVRLHLNVRNKHFVTVDTKIKGGNVDIVYVDSKNMNYEKLSSGQEIIHPKYNSWVKYLLKSARAAAKKAGASASGEADSPEPGN